MPKRTNEFQRLVYLVRVNLAAGAKVSESKMMRDRLTKRFREVDVVVEGNVGSQPVVVSIECRDHKRIADVTWVDAMKTKHERLDTHALLLASRAGFTPEARDVAQKYGIQLFSLEDLESADFGALLGRDGTVWLKTVAVTSQEVRIQLAETDELSGGTVGASSDNLLYLEDGSELCQVRELVDRFLRSHKARDFLLSDAKEDDKWFELEWTPPADHVGRPIYMKRLEPEGLQPVSQIRVVGPCRVGIARFGMRQGQLGGFSIAWGKTHIAGKDAMAVATVLENGQTKLSINFSGAP